MIYIGLDAEWQSFQNIEDSTPVSLLQIATLDKVYLVDMLKLCKPVETNLNLETDIKDSKH